MTAATIAALSHLIRRNNRKNGHAVPNRETVRCEDPEQSLGHVETDMAGKTKNRIGACLERGDYNDATVRPGHATVHDRDTSGQRSEKLCSKENEQRREHLAADRTFVVRVESLEQRCDLIERALQKARIDMDKVARCGSSYDSPGHHPEDHSMVVPGPHPVRRSARITAKKLRESLQGRRSSHASSMEALVPKTASKSLLRQQKT